ncbi:RagB/SusD family nutrient uptake outer membrane protein [Pedobacter hiemivivus]|uniref:RagB/SusD family nutrient uptake outer membrane protein n=1 Tax=Pedobacter hiemivivus TaxID=2530454 RepID=A0A4U1GE46_9SPHI|nr:RagB/SusD family nutrient uptake outer membrane protein [Pedobacter hiemivivus]TKC61250.1 RagB/SusD family nutrient uptake outer membrane protein [Pedobacter hiemivivus]
MIHYKKYLMLFGLVSCLAISACKDSFFDQAPQDAITVDNYYTTADQVKASTNVLYNKVWFLWNNKAAYCIGEVASGNGRSYAADVVNFVTISATANNTEVINAWTGMYTVVAQANALINTLPSKVPASVPSAVLNNALGEAHFMRGLAYFYLVRMFGNVPIVENSLDLATNFKVNTNPVPDVYRFIINDLKFAEENCTKMVRGAPSTAQGRVSSGSAAAMLAKVYLNMEDYPNARLYAEKVINSGEFKLYGVDLPDKTYHDLFLTANNNNEESVAALQWVAGGPYATGNSLQASLATNSIITGTGDGWSVVSGTYSLLETYEAGDKRKRSTVMMKGDVYPEINQATGGLTIPSNWAFGNTGIGVKKYVVGTPADNGGKGATQSTGNNTYLMRYAEVLLIAAEAVLGSASVTSDAAALGPFNKIRSRAGLGLKTEITKIDIFKERRIEFAIEFDYWFDLCRMDGFNVKSHPIAKAIVNAQNRGVAGTPMYLNVTDDQFLFAYPEIEVSANPKLKEAPVPYVFK